MHFFQQILNDLGVKYTVSYAKNLFESRSDANTLYGVKKMLEHFDISLTAIRMGDPLEVTYPCVIQDQGWIRVLRKASPETNLHSGAIVLLITDKGMAREPDLVKHRFQQLFRRGMPYLATLAALFLVACSFLFYGEGARFDVHKLILSLLNGAGIFFSWRTVTKECSGTCHEVLESSASKLFGIISLGVIGLAYFIGSLIIVLFIPALAPTLALISCAALVMPIWSISYQAFVVRAWCINCLGVQGVLLFTFVTEWGFHRISLGQMQWVTFLPAIALYVLLFYITNRIYEMAQSMKSFPQNLVHNYNQMMKDPAIKESVIKQGTSFDTTGASTIVLSNTPAAEGEAAHELVLVISPFCSHCRDLFLKVNEMLDSNLLDAYRVAILFANEPAGLPISSSVIAEYQQHGAKAARILLEQWYHRTKIKSFRKRYARLETNRELVDEITRQKTWLAQNKIVGAPVMLVDSHVVSHLLLDSIV